LNGTDKQKKRRVIPPFSFGVIRGHAAAMMSGERGSQDEEADRQAGWLNCRFSDTDENMPYNLKVQQKDKRRL